MVRDNDQIIIIIILKVDPINIIKIVCRASIPRDRNSMAIVIIIEESLILINRRWKILSRLSLQYSKQRLYSNSYGVILGWKYRPFLLQLLDSTGQGPPLHNPTHPTIMVPEPHNLCQLYLAILGESDAIPCKTGCLICKHRLAIVLEKWNIYIFAISICA